MENSKLVIEKVGLMKACEPRKMTMAVAMLERAKLAEKTSVYEKPEIDDIKPCSRLAMDDFIFYVSMLGYDLDKISVEELNKCKNKFIENLKNEIDSMREINA